MQAIMKLLKDGITGVGSRVSPKIKLTTFKLGTITFSIQLFQELSAKTIQKSFIGQVHPQRHGLKIKVLSLVTLIIGVFLLEKKTTSFTIRTLADSQVSMECSLCRV